MPRWSKWHQDPDNPRVQVSRKIDKGWVHFLMSPIVEANPEGNHVHIKYKYEKGRLSYPESEGTVCSVKIDGRRYIESKEFIDKMNRLTNDRIPYAD